MDYNQLSIAAKSIHILESGGQPMRPSDITQKAMKFGWNVSEDAVDKAIDYLQRLDLVTTKAE